MTAVSSTARGLRRVVGFRALAALLMLSAAGASTACRAAEPAIQLFGKGVQIYTCENAAGAVSWRLKAPDAVLTDASGATVGHHFAGPTWQATDGSAVVGSPLVASPAAQAGSIPWLVLSAKAHEGVGRFANVAYVVRSQTEGGVAPRSGCDAAHLGSEVRVGYAATYLFFPAAAGR